MSLLERLHLADAIWTDPTTNMEFLPAGASVRSASEVLASDAAKSLFDKLQIEYDYVIVDLPPLIAGVDVRATSDLIDSYLLVVEWGATKIDAVQYALRDAPGVHANIVGAVLNKVDMATIGRYDRHGANYYYGRTATSALSELTMLRIDVGTSGARGQRAVVSRSHAGKERGKSRIASRRAGI